MLLKALQVLAAPFSPFYSENAAARTALKALFSTSRFYFQAMKFSHFRRASIALFALASTCSVAPIARAQTAAPNAPIAPAKTLPVLEAVPATLSGDGGSVILRLAPGVVPPQRVRIGLFEAGRAARVADVRRTLQIVNGRAQIELRVDAEPGRYQWRLLTDDKLRAPLTQSAPLVVSGLERQPAWRLLNGTAIFSRGANEIAPTNGKTAPKLFLSGLKRDDRNDTQISTQTPLQFQTLPLPINAPPDLDAAALRARLRDAVNQARVANQRDLLGWSFLVDAANLKDQADINRWEQQWRLARAAIQNVTPEAALILQVENSSANDAAFEMAARVIDRLAPDADAVIVAVSNDEKSLWPLKAARRIAEESENYDLPIWAQMSANAPQTLQWQALLSGATGIVAADNVLQVLAVPNNSIDVARDLFASNITLLVGSVTLEDSGLWMPPLSADNAPDGVLDVFEKWRALGRVPLLARTPSEGKRNRVEKDRNRGQGESFAVAVRPIEAESTLQAIRETIERGNRVLIMGSPFSSDQTAPLRAAWEQLLLSKSRPFEAQQTNLAPRDPWVFGTFRGEKVAVTQNQTITPTVTPAPDDAPTPKKARDEIVAPRVVATLDDNSAGVLIVPSSKPGDVTTGRARGEIVWVPHQLSTSDANAADFASALAAYLSPALVQLRERDAKDDEAVRGVRVAVRASSRGTLLVGLFNQTNRARALTLSVQALAENAFDLRYEVVLPSRVRGLRVETDVTLLPDDWTWLAFAQNQKALDDERNAPRWKARVR